jgi:hypothetical protein
VLNALDQTLVLIVQVQAIEFWDMILQGIKHVHVFLDTLQLLMEVAFKMDVLEVLIAQIVIKLMEHQYVLNVLLQQTDI